MRSIVSDAAARRMICAIWTPSPASGRQLLAAALETEVAESIETAPGERDEKGHALAMRSGADVRVNAVELVALVDAAAESPTKS